jgi:autotransporter-associated beta strand protein
VLGDVSGGGLEKCGSGELRLKRANTYTGATVVSGGSLVLVDEGSIAASGSLTVGAGAELSVENGAALDFDTVAGCGTVKGDLVVSGTLKVKASDLLARRCLHVQGTVTFAPSASIVVEQDAELPEESRTLIRASGGVAGAPAAVSGFDGNRFFSVQGGACRLVYPRSVGIIVR